MNKVYILIWQEWDAFEIIGVYKTERLAENAKAKMPYKSSYSVYEFNVLNKGIISPEERTVI